MKKLQNLKNNQGLIFVIIGGFNTILDFAILFSLKFLGFVEIFANGISTGITFIISFILNKKYTFKSHNKSRKELVREMILFTLVTLFGLWVIQSVVILTIKTPLQKILPNLDFLNFTLSKETLSLLTSKIIATFFSLVWNFIMYKKVVFQHKK